MKDFTGTAIRSVRYGEGKITSWDETVTKTGRRFKASFPSVDKEVEFSCPLAFNKALSTQDAGLLAQIEQDKQLQKECNEDFAVIQQANQEKLQQAGQENLNRYRIKSRRQTDSGIAAAPAAKSGKAAMYGMYINMANSALEKGRGHVCIGWSPMGDLSKISSRDELKELYLKTYPDHKKKEMETDVGEIWTFISKVKPGDLVVYFDTRGGSQVAHFGKIVSDYYYDPGVPGQDADYVNNRDVEWLKDFTYQELRDDNLPPEESLAKTIGTRHSIWTLKEAYRNHIAKLLEGIYDLHG